ncbi:MAG: O-antigen ligase family protein [Candidatus Binatia bacterium]|nr:O-antigen ligase family protein [Candidatus Binatia bacterium]
MSSPSLPISRPATRRRTSATPGIPLWSVGVLVIYAIFLAYAALTDEKLAIGGAFIGLALVGAVAVFYQPLIGVLIIMSTMLVSYPDALKGSPPLTINNLLGASLILMLTWHLYQTRDFWFFREKEIRLLLMIAVWFIAISYVSELYLPEKRLLPSVEVKGSMGRFYGVSDDSGRWMFELLSRVAFVIFFIQWVKTPSQLRTVLIVLAACIAAALPTLGGEIIAGEADYRISSKSVGWAVNLNRFAFMMNVGIALFVYLAVTARSIAVRTLFFFLAICSVPLVLLSASRSGFLGLALVGFMLLKGPQVPRRWKIGSGFFGIAIFVLAFNFALTENHRERLLNLNPFAPAASTDGSASAEGSRSTQVRTTTLAEATTIISEYPITGVGLANFRWVNAIMHGSYKPPHNSYIWSLAEGGIIAGLLYLSLFAALYTRIQKLRPKYKNHETLPYLPEFLNLYLILLLFFSIFADVWLEVHVYFLVAIAVVLSRWAEDEELRGRGLPGQNAGTAGARRAAARALYRPQGA